MALAPSVLLEKNETEIEHLSKCFGQALAKINASTYILHGGAKFGKKSDAVKLQSQMFLLSTDENGDIQSKLIPQGGTKPSKRYNHHICSIGNQLLLFGGVSSSAWKVSEPGTYQFNLMTRTWSVITIHGRTPPQVCNSANVVNNLVFVFGGMSYGETVNTMSIFDHQQQQWILASTLGTPPSPRCDHSAAAVKQLIYYFGGCSSATEYLHDLHTFDTGSLSWQQIHHSHSHNLIPRASALLLAHQTKDLYVIGGHNDVLYPDGGPLVDNLMKYSIKSNRWKLVQSALEEDRDALRSILARSYATGFLSQSRLYIIGGMTCEGESGDCVHKLRILHPSERSLLSRGASLPNANANAQPHQPDQSKKNAESPASLHGDISPDNAYANQEMASFIDDILDSANAEVRSPENEYSSPRPSGGGMSDDGLQRKTKRLSDSSDSLEDNSRQNEMLP